MKVLNANHSALRFQQETRTAGSLKHENIASIFDLGSSKNNQLYMSLELVDGITLEQLLKEERRISVEEIIEIMIQLLSALEYAHRANVVHRDIKPGNIMVIRSEQDVRVKVLDFGIAKRLGEGDVNLTLTKQGVIVGSPLYMSPEQSREERITDKSDMYSVGCVLYECLTGRPPFVAETALTTMLLHQSEPVPRIGEELRERGETLEQLVTLLMAKNPARRPTAGEAKERLASLQESNLIKPPQAIPESADGSSTNVSKIVIVAVSSALGLFLLGVFLFIHRAPTENIRVNGRSLELMVTPRRDLKIYVDGLLEGEGTKCDLALTVPRLVDDDLAELSRLEGVKALVLKLPPRITDDGLLQLTNTIGACMITRLRWHTIRLVWHFEKSTPDRRH
ncbi:MAG: serine/threonine protein kinase [Candidatus Obscuribacterales bacterium]|nr:serine/threonine protein kinase [Candidatus Obscuribacterales bacterium]